MAGLENRQQRWQVLRLETDRDRGIASSDGGRSWNFGVGFDGTLKRLPEMRWGRFRPPQKETHN